MPAQMMKVFLKRMFVVFFARVRPDSTMAKPRCMMNTNAAANIIQTLFAVKRAGEISSASATLGARLQAITAAVRRSFRDMGLDSSGVWDRVWDT